MRFYFVMQRERGGGSTSSIETARAPLFRSRRFSSGELRFTERKSADIRRCRRRRRDPSVGSGRGTPGGSGRRERRTTSAAGGRVHLSLTPFSIATEQTSHLSYHWQIVSPFVAAINTTKFLSVGQITCWYVNLLSVNHEPQSTDVAFDRRRRRTYLTQIVSQINATAFEIMKSVINSGKG
ncbi:hypothetical protein EVAR_25274_1 [Eumeta japonica]|uniref:Uncharacterized protein n=1 Tax=Eumeta variegata TaxID=151549 RepID=A0A4C1VPU0_EUMVA|nr:hypothetical protein EVAR_25274_1 [Eumeta japonica]